MAYEVQPKQDWKIMACFLTQTFCRHKKRNAHNSLNSNTKVRRKAKGGEIASICLPDRNPFWMCVCFCPFWKQQMMKFPLGKWFESLQLMSWLSSFLKTCLKRTAFLLSCLSVSLCSHILTLYSSNRVQSKRNRFLFQEFFSCRKVKYK